MIDAAKMAKKLVALRGNRTIEKVASDIGISKSALSMYENGNRIPKDEIKLKLANYYDQSIAFLFFNTVDHET